MKKIIYSILLIGNVLLFTGCTDDKPIFITEFGVKGPEAYQKKWLEEAAATINKYPEIIGVSYFNAADSPKAWGDAEIPDWSITAATLKSFAGLLKNVQNY